MTGKLTRIRNTLNVNGCRLVACVGKSVQHFQKPFQIFFHRIARGDCLVHLFNLEFERLDCLVIQVDFHERRSTVLGTKLPNVETTASTSHAPE